MSAGTVTAFVVAWVLARRVYPWWGCIGPALAAGILVDAVLAALGRLP